MSWSLHIVGVPEKVCEKIDEYSTTLTDFSKVEFDEVKEHLKGICKQVVNNPDSIGSYGSLIALSASGHGTFKDNVKQSGQITVKLDPFYGTLAL